MVRFYKKEGYKYFANSGISVHRYVAGRKLGRPLKPGEVVHHKNEDKTDNRRSNLKVCKSQEQHHRIHMKNKKRFGFW